MPFSNDGDDDLLRPREAANMFGVRPATIARWTREGKLSPLRTPGGHRRYRLREMRTILNGIGVDSEQSPVEEDATRLDDQP
jgi:excisionase family DNA binding protein